MATQNLDSADLKGALRGGMIREDVMNKIWDISKIPLPFTDMIGSTDSKQEYKEWTTDELAPPNLNNAAVDGQDTPGNDARTGLRVGNHHQISTKVVRVSYRADASDTIGRAKELAYQIMRRQQELKRDVEAIALSNQASVADNGDAIAGKAGGLATWLETNVPAGVTPGGFNPSTGLTESFTGGVGAGFSETDVRDVVEMVYANGGDPTIMMSTPKVIRRFSEYLFSNEARVSTITSDQGPGTEKAVALGSVNVFVTDFGTLRMIPNRLQQTYSSTDGTPKAVSAIYIIDPEYISLSYLHGYRTDELAKTGLAENRLMSVDWTLMVNTEKAHGMIPDVDPSVPVVAA